MKVNIKSLKATKFTSLTPNRDAIIEKAANTAIVGPDNYLANKIAKALHPKVQHVKVANIIDRSPDTKSFVLTYDKQKGSDSLAYFSAGQYISITLKIGDLVITRPYSLSSSPKQALQGEYEITIKKVNDGLASTYILDNFTIGTSFDISAPLGHFTYEPLRDAKNVIGIAGGSGITPFLSLAKAIADNDEDFNLTLLYGSRNMEDSLFKEEFEDIEKRTNKFKLVRVLSESEQEGCEKGFISADLIKKYAPNDQYSIFICGPQAMYNFVDKEIETLNIRQKFVRHELFGEYKNIKDDLDYKGANKEILNVTVVINGEEKTVEVNANDTILVGLEKAGIKVPAHCRSGECGWCHSRLISGDIYAPKKLEYRRLADLQYGYIHPCCSYALSDLKIEIPEKI